MATLSSQGMDDLERESLVPVLPEGKLLRLNDWEESGAWVFAGAVVLIGLLIALPVNGRGVGTCIAGLVIVGVGAGIAGVARSGVIVASDGVVVRKLFKSRYLRWSEVDHFAVRAPILRGALRIYLVDGTILSTPGLDGRSRRERDVSRSWIAELNRRAAARSVSPDA